MKERSNIKNIYRILFLLIVSFFCLNLYSNNFEKSFEFHQNIENDSLIKLEYNLIKELYERKNYKTSLKKSLYLYELSKTKKNKEIEILSGFLVAEIFLSTNNLEKALRYYQESLKLYKNEIIILDDRKLNNIIKNYSYASNLLQIGAIYHRMEKIDSAKHYYDKILNLESLDASFLKTKARTYSNLSDIFNTYKDYENLEKAEDYALKAILIHQNLNNKLSEAISSSNLANIYLKQNKLEKAKELYFKAIRLIKYDKGIKATNFKELFYDNLAYTLYNQKNYIAYEYLDKSFQIRDSLREVEISNALAEIEAKHNVDVAKKLVRKEEEVKLLKAQTKTKTVLAYSILAIVFLLGLAGYFKYRQKRLSLKLSLNDLKLEKIKTESQTKILNATLDGKESERKEIAETLHDNVSTLLSSASFHLQASKKQFNGAMPIEIKKSQSIITEAAKKIRDLSHTLVSSVLLKFGLKIALLDISEKYSNSNIQVNVTVDDVARYEEKFEIRVYNIVQELINNILKHSKATIAEVYLLVKDNKLHIRIEDNGIGFKVKEVTKKDGLGINQIDARIQVMKGTFQVNSVLNKGTKIKIVIPIQEKTIPIEVEKEVTV